MQYKGRSLNIRERLLFNRRYAVVSSHASGLTDRLCSDKASPFCFGMATLHGVLLLLSGYAQGPPGGQRRSKRWSADNARIRWSPRFVLMSRPAPIGRGQTRRTTDSTLFFVFVGGHRRPIALDVKASPYWTRTNAENRGFHLVFRVRRRPSVSHCP